MQTHINTARTHALARSLTRVFFGGPNQICHVHKHTPGPISSSSPLVLLRLSPLSPPPSSSCDAQGPLDLDSSSLGIRKSPDAPGPLPPVLPSHCCRCAPLIKPPMPVANRYPGSSCKQSWGPAMRMRPQFSYRTLRVLTIQRRSRLKIPTSWTRTSTRRMIATARHL